MNSSPQLDNGITTANTLTYAGTGGDVSVSHQNLTATAAEQYQQAGRVAIGIPVPFYRPTLANTAIAFDISPNGTPSDFSANTGVSWIDICSIDCTGAVTNYETLRLGKFSSSTHTGAAHISAASGGTGSNRNLILQLNGAGVGVGTPPTTQEIVSASTLTSWGTFWTATPTLNAVTAGPALGIQGTYQNSGTPTFAADQWQWTQAIAAGTNGSSSFVLTHTGTTGSTTVKLPTGSIFQFGHFMSAATATPTLEADVSTTGVLLQGGTDATTGVLGQVILRGADITGGSTSATASMATVRGGNNASSSATGTAGDAVLEGGGASAGGKQGHAKMLQPLTTNAAITAHMVVCGTTTGYQVAACALGAVNIVGEGETVGGTGTQILVGTVGEFTVVFDGTPTIGDVACGPPTATGTIGLAHDNVLAGCPTGQTLGVIIGDVSGSGSGATATVAIK